MTFPSEQEFRAWLDGMPDDARPCEKLKYCPLRQFTGLKVLPHTYRLDADGEDIPLPEWAKVFVFRIDGMTTRYHNLTVAEIRAALDAGGG